MSLNIRSERAVALVRELAARTGTSQTAAVEDAVARRLAELDRDETARADARHEAAEEVLLCSRGCSPTRTRGRSGETKLN